MKKFKFGLNSVLRLRKMEEEHARMFLTESQAEVDRATAELDARLLAIGTSRPDPGRYRGPEFQDEREQLERHAIAVTAARSAEANALASMRTARSEWEEAAQRVRALERLNEKHHESWILEATKHAQIATDEIAQTHFRRSIDR